MYNKKVNLDDTIYVDMEGNIKLTSEATMNQNQYKIGETVRYSVILSQKLVGVGMDSDSGKTASGGEYYFVAIWPVYSVKPMKFSVRIEYLQNNEVNIWLNAIAKKQILR